MNRRQAKRRACRLAADLIYQYLQRDEARCDWTREQSDKVDAALLEIAKEMARRAALVTGRGATA